MDIDKMILKKPDSFVGCHILPMQKRMRKRMTNLSLKKVMTIDHVKTTEANEFRRIYGGLYKGQ